MGSPFDVILLLVCAYMYMLLVNTRQGRWLQSLFICTCDIYLSGNIHDSYNAVKMLTE